MYYCVLVTFPYPHTKKKCEEKIAASEKTNPFSLFLDYCKGKETLQNLCEQIAGDALLYSLFKENAEPVKCPLRGSCLYLYVEYHIKCIAYFEISLFVIEQDHLRLPTIGGTESADILFQILKVVQKKVGYS